MMLVMLVTLAMAGQVPQAGAAASTEAPSRGENRLPPLVFWMAKGAGCAVAPSPLKAGCTISAMPGVAGVGGRCEGVTATLFLDEKTCLAALPTPAATLVPFEKAASGALTGCLESIGTTTLDASTVPAATLLLQICACSAPGIAGISQRGGGSGRDVARVSVDCMRRAGHHVSDEALKATEAHAEQMMPAAGTTSAPSSPPKR